MTTLIHRTGDLFTSTAPALAHGVNIDGVMGGGIARLFADRYPAMKARYVTVCRAGKLVPGGVFAWDGAPFIYNLASQDRPGPNAHIGWLESSLTLMVADAAQRGFDRVALPQIGCGIGGLDYADVLPLLERTAQLSGVDLEVWTLG